MYVESRVAGDTLCGGGSPLPVVAVGPAGQETLGLLVWLSRSLSPYSAIAFVPPGFPLALSLALHWGLLECFLTVPGPMLLPSFS